MQPKNSGQSPDKEKKKVVQSSNITNIEINKESKYMENRKKFDDINKKVIMNKANRAISYTEYDAKI